MTINIEAKKDEKEVCMALGISAIEKLPRGRYNHVLARLEATINEN